LTATESQKKRHNTQRDRSRDGAWGASTNFGPVETYVMCVVCFYFISVSLPHTAVYSVY